MRRLAASVVTVSLLLAIGCRSADDPARPGRDAVDLSPAAWPADERTHYLHEVQATTRTTAGVASGSQGAVTVAYNGFAARAGLEALKQGGTAVDAALTAAPATSASRRRSSSPKGLTQGSGGRLRRLLEHPRETTPLKLSPGSGSASGRWRGPQKPGPRNWPDLRIMCSPRSGIGRSATFPVLSYSTSSSVSKTGRLSRWRVGFDRC